VEFSPSHSLKFANPYPRKTSTSRGPKLRRWKPRRMFVLEQRRWQLQVKQVIVFLSSAKSLWSLTFSEPDKRTQREIVLTKLTALFIVAGNLFIYFYWQRVLPVLLCYCALLLCAWWRAWLRHHLLLFCDFFPILSWTRPQVVQVKKKKKKHNRLFLLFFSSLSIFCFFTVNEDKQERLKCLLFSFYHFILPGLIFHSLNMYDINLSFFFL
jgi:hypothetical protein